MFEKLAQLVGSGLRKTHPERKPAIYRAVAYERLRFEEEPHWRGMDGASSDRKAAAIPRSVRGRLEALGLIVRDDYGQLVLTEMGRRLIATPN
jgi:hypothetical protein